MAIIAENSMKIIGKKVFIKGDYVDLFIRLNNSQINKKHQFRQVHSEVYDCEEFIWRGWLKKGYKVVFAHGDGRTLPNINVFNQISGPGITLSGGEACADLKFDKALTCPVENCDLIYNFMDPLSVLTYIGKDGLHTVFVRVYDNNSGDDNDRWLVISID